MYRSGKSWLTLSKKIRFKKKLKVPPKVQWIISVMTIGVMLLSLFRLFFFIWFKPVGYVFPIPAFILGLRFDLRLIGMMGLIMFLFSSVNFLNPFKSRGAEKFWYFFLPILFLFIFTFYILDFYHYQYLQERLNASILNYVENISISMKMVGQTYPVVKIILLLIIFVFIFYFLLQKWFTILKRVSLIHIKRNWLWNGMLLLFILISTWGTLNQFPLRWSNAYALGEEFKAEVALNPFQTFFSSMSFRHSGFDAEKTKKGYLVMADYLGVDHRDSMNLKYERTIHPSNFYHIPAKTNVIIVICESFSTYKSSMCGNPLHATPFFNELCNNGIYFDHCFTPSFGTARGVWAIITGIPDVESPKTASRNLSIVDQHTLINDFNGYSKFYFIGGDANWANIRGLLDNNIKGLHIFEQQQFKSGQLNVWGISDKNLFLEANKILSVQHEPFFAVIQTADNHRPYSIPKEDLNEFNKLKIPDDTLNHYGFASIEEFNSFRYTDYCFKKFINAARQTRYFDSTLFVFVGDHGVAGNVGTMFPRVWQDQRLDEEHVPLLFYNPSHLPPSKPKTICSQLDILPSVCSLLSQQLTNTTMGRNLFDSLFQSNKLSLPGAFINDPDKKKSGVVTDDYYFRKDMQTGATNIFSMKSDREVVRGRYYDSLSLSLKTLTEAFYETAKYLLYHNKKVNNFSSH